MVAESEESGEADKPRWVLTVQLLPRSEEKVGGIGLDDTECRSHWWSTLPDAKDSVTQRLEQVLRRVQYDPCESIVLVGHSHWLREFLRAYLHEDVATRDPELAAQLKSRKLSNCGVACLDL